MFRMLLAALAALALALVVAPVAGALPDGTPQQVVTGLQTPWEILPTGSGRVLVTERPGRIRVIQDGVLQPAPVFTDPTPGITVQKFLGLAADPGYAANRLLYLYETYTEAGVDKSRVLRLVDQGASMSVAAVILDGIASDLNHDGGRMAFGPDGKLYITTGDIHQPARPQDVDNLNGKILRIETDGSAPADNPFNDGDGTLEIRDRVWSIGHRHPQGLAFDAQGRLWETEHGPSNEGHAPAGATNGRDELNLIVKGGNYGWPTVAGEQTAPGTIAPVVQSGPAPAWAPGDLAFHPNDGVLYAPMLNGEHLRAFVPDGAGGIASHQPLYQGTFGRLRVAVADGDALWIAVDGARILRVAIPAAPAPPAAAPAPVAPASAPVVATQSLTGPRVSLGAAMGTALTRVRARLRALRLRGLLRRGDVAVRAGGFPRGRVTLRLALIRPGRRRLTVAVGTVRVRTRGLVTVRARLTPRGRRALKRIRRATLLVHLVATPATGGAPTRQTARVTVRR